MKEPMRHGHDLQSINAIGKESPSSKPFIWVVAIIVAISLFRALPDHFDSHVQKWQQKDDLQILGCEVEESKQHYTLYIKLRNNGSNVAEGMPYKIKTDNGLKLTEREYTVIDSFVSLASGITLEPVGIPARADGMVEIHIAKNAIIGTKSMTVYFDAVEDQKIKVNLP